ncbi:DUF3368 domain-containing protein [Lewinella sp. 4G2]|uniref:DUF3368 domain-containing protein n=1 Tax=Lewinella sp. 4G2 TaxID=1803372 RepID=UPI0007B4720A|nr:DUF3368 domain-containing protein [Lewinella sp. 4G2]OAV42611.1 hypothetical protein A3850_015300 [Lewinella sp. 4G2]
MIIIADSSPIIALIGIQRLDLLRDLFDTVIITDVVRGEIYHSLPDWIQVETNYSKTLYESFRERLDAGEASALAIASDIDDARLIIDEIKGRKQAASLSISFIGTIGLVILAKQRGLIKNGKDVLQDLVDDGFWLSDTLFEKALLAMGESA